MSIITNTDSYKASHFLQYPPGTEYISSYIEARGVSDNFPTMKNAKIPFFGLQAFLMSKLVSAFFLNKAIFNSADRDLIKSHGLPFNDQWEEIYKLGYLPLRIQALPEGTPVYPGEHNYLEDVFVNGEIVRTQSFDDIRERAKI